MPESVEAHIERIRRHEDDVRTRLIADITDLLKKNDIDPKLFQILVPIYDPQNRRMYVMVNLSPDSLAKIGPIATREVCGRALDTVSRSLPDLVRALVKLDLKDAPDVQLSTGGAVYVVGRNWSFGPP